MPVSRTAWDNVVLVTRDGSVDSTWDGKVKNLIYDVNTMAWIAQEASAGGAASSVTVTNFPATQAVSGTVTANTGLTQPLTDTQLRATAVPVSGTFYQATQPVSLASAPTTPVTGTFWQATQPVSGTITANAGSGTMAVSAAALPLPSGASTETTLSAVNTKLVQLTLNGDRLKVDVPAGASGLTDSELRATAVPVSGTFYPATQAVSGTVTANAGTGTMAVSLATAPTTPVTGTFWQTTQPVSGTFWQTTQPVSAASLPLPTGAATETTLAALNTKVTAVNTGAVTISAALPTGTNSIGTVVAPAITKGTQAATGFTVQRLNDAGRNTRNFQLDAYTVAPAVEAVQTVVQWYGNAAVGGTAQPAVVPAGKTLRLCSWTISTKSLATVGSAVVRVRANTAGLGVLASPLVFSFEAGSRAGATTVAMTGGLDTLTGVFPEGFELPAGTGVAFSMAGYGPTGTLAVQGVTRFQVYGYEY